MLDHHIQRNIVYKLAFTSVSKFSELKPDDVDSKLFSYHLKKVVNTGLVNKNDYGLYELTPEGRRIATRIFDKQLEFLDRPDSVLFLIIRRKKDNAWLLYKRTVHPLLGKIGFMHASPKANERCKESASRICKDKTGISTSFKVLGGGYFKVFEGENLESYTHFTLMIGALTDDEISQNDEYAEYFWSKEPDFSAEEMLPNMSTLAKLYEENEQFFIEKTFSIK